MATVVAIRPPLPMAARGISARTGRRAPPAPLGNLSLIPFIIYCWLPTLMTDDSLLL
jgi:hypothetical protein